MEKMDIDEGNALTDANSRGEDSIFAKTNEEARRRVEEEANLVGLTPESFRVACCAKIFEGLEGPSFLIRNGLAKKLNIIFDIDHTLVYSVDVKQWPKLDQDPSLPKIDVGKAVYSLYISYSYRWIEVQTCLVCEIRCAGYVRIP